MTQVQQLATNDVSQSVTAEFNNFLLMFHYLTVSSVCCGIAELEVVSTKAAVALLRYADVYPADRAFYDAGAKAKVNPATSFSITASAQNFLIFFFKLKAIGWDSIAFVLLNRFLDIADLMEEEQEGKAPAAAALDNSDFEQTDVPFEKLLIAERTCVSGMLREETKEWVLAVSLDQRIQQVQHSF